MEVLEAKKLQVQLSKFPAEMLTGTDIDANKIDIAASFEAEEKG